MIFTDLRDRNSQLVQNALLRHCPVCGVDSGMPCVTLTDRVPIVEKWGNWTHLIRADELPYTSAEKKARKKK